MSSHDFTLFQVLLDRVYKLAFGEALSSLPYAKAKTLSWAIFEATGHRISYKSLISYVRAAQSGNGDGINPNGSTLGILVHYAQTRDCQPAASAESLGRLWFQFRKKWLEDQVAAEYPSRLQPVNDSRNTTTPSSAA